LVESEPDPHRLLTMIPLLKRLSFRMRPLSAAVLGLGIIVNLTFAGDRKFPVRPDSPDNFELTGKIREFIVKTSGEGNSASDLKPYTETIRKGPEPQEFKMMPIPAGEFVMGSPDTEAERKPDEGPQVRVHIDAFWMCSTEVTWDLYNLFMLTPDARWKDGSKKYHDPKAPLVDAVSAPTAPYTDMTFGLGSGQHPAICMTEHAANKFCQWLSAQTGHYYRLPTEAEWEYAARAGTTTAYSFGDDVSKLGEYAWFFGNSGEEGGSHPVGTLKPNPWGLYDMHGNVVEWVMDQYSPDFYAKLKAQAGAGRVENPYNTPFMLYPRVVRGGSWDDDPKDLRSASRRSSNPNWKAMDADIPKSLWYHTSAQFLGMRVVRPLKLPPVEAMHDAWNRGAFRE
jgi:formylglycine-generating enzyme required for sulfatase activity